jgi:hypothetical protein
VRQYVTQVRDAAFTPTFGARYFFSHVNREEVSLNLQASVLFSPNLSLEVFAQPLIAAGDFVSYKQLARAASFDFMHFSEGQALDLGGAVGCSRGDLWPKDGVIYID